MATSQGVADAQQPAAKEYKYTVYFISHGGWGNPWWSPIIKDAGLADDLVV